MYIKDNFDDNGGCIKINKLIEILFDKKIDNFFCYKSEVKIFFFNSIFF